MSKWLYEWAKPLVNLLLILFLFLGVAALLLFIGEHS